MAAMRWVLVFASGCMTSGLLETRGTTTSGDHSLELGGAVAGGIADSDGGFVFREQGSVGLSSRGTLEGHVETGPEYVSFGERVGWQAGLFTGAALGAFQDQDLTFEAVGGPHWNFSRETPEHQIKMWSLALELGVGYAFQIETNGGAGGAFVSLDVALRYDLIDTKLP